MPELAATSFGGVDAPAALVFGASAVGTSVASRRVFVQDWTSSSSVRPSALPCPVSSR
jgi:hypothetical protein